MINAKENVSKRYVYICILLYIINMVIRVFMQEYKHSALILHRSIHLEPQIIDASE